jgi:hypothetical protein
MAKPQPAQNSGSATSPLFGYVTAIVWKNDDFFSTVLSKS